MKKLLSLALVSTFVMLTAFNTSAATYVQGAQVGTVISKTPTNIFYKDLVRMEEVATDTNGKQARIVNATRYNGSSTTWIVRLDVGTGEEKTSADYVLNVVPYKKDTLTNQILEVPANGKAADGVPIYGPSWYYFGVYDDSANHNLCGFVVAERIHRFASWKDLNFSGTNKRGISYTGSYTEESKVNFLETHIETVGN